MKLFQLGLLFFTLSACVDKGPPQRKIDPNYIQGNLLSTVPVELDFVVNAKLGNKVEYLGGKVDAKNLTPGGAGRIVHFWKVLEAPGDQWRVFTHISGKEGEWINIDASDMRTGYPPGKWKVGDIIRDEQKFSLDKNWSAENAVVSVGMYRKGVEGVEARMEITAGPKDNERQIPAFTFSVPRTDAKAASVSNYQVRKTMVPMVIDGKADEKAWKQAPLSPLFSNTKGGRAVGADTKARLLWDETYLYAFIQVSDTDIFSQYHAHDDPLWKQDVVELFIDADKNGSGYIELQVNPNNAQFDAWFPKNRGQKHHFEWNAHMKSAVQIHGTADNRGDRDQGWDVEIAIPLIAVKGMDSSMSVAVPPALGDQWKLNLVRGEKPKDKGLAASSWNPITVQDFHALDRMLTAVFVDAEGNKGVLPKTEIALPDKKKQSLSPNDEQPLMPEKSPVGTDMPSKKTLLPHGEP